MTDEITQRKQQFVDTIEAFAGEEANMVVLFDGGTFVLLRLQGPGLDIVAHVSRTADGFGIRKCCDTRDFEAYRQSLERIVPALQGMSG